MPGEFYIEGQAEKLDIGDIKDLIAQVQNDIADLRGDVSSLLTAIGGQLPSIDFWSDPLEEVQIDAAGITVPLPGLTVAGLPDGAIPVRAVAMFKFRMVGNTNAAANKLSGGTVANTSQVIQVRNDTPGAWVDGINFVNGQYGLDASTREAGDVCIGSVDISSILIGNGGYEFQWLLGRADLDFITFNEVQTGIRVWYSIAPS
jgi:hypothetical protein